MIHGKWAVRTFNGKMGTVRSKLFPSFSIMPFQMETFAACSNLAVCFITPV